MLQEIDNLLDDLDAMGAPNFLRGGVEPAQLQQQLNFLEAAGINILIDDMEADDDAPADRQLRATVFDELAQHDEQRSRRCRDIAWFCQRRDEPLFEGSPMTVLRSAWIMLSNKVKSSMHDDTFDQFMKDFAAMLPEGNLFPGCVAALPRMCALVCIPQTAAIVYMPLYADI